MALLLAIGVGLVAWPLLSHTFPNVFSQIPLSDTWQNSEVIVTPSLSAFIANTLAHDNITGLAAAVVSKSDEPEFHTWGHRTEDGDPVTPETLFHMASVSKAFCATALGLLIDDFAQGANITALPAGLAELTWHTRLRDLLPEDWALMDVWASERATLRDILSHVSGLPRHDASYGPTDTPLEMVKRLRHLRPAFELREQFSYNNIMFMVAAHVIATYSGRPYTSFVEERIFAPLGMTSSTFSPTRAEVSGNFTQGWTKEGRRVPECFTEATAFAMAGPGGVISNAIDMAKWISTWINQGVHEDHIIFPQSVYQNTSYSYSVATDHPADSRHSIVGYGMGWFRTSYRGHDVVYHSGAVPGLSTLVAFLPGDRVGVTLFANGESKAEQLTLILNCILDSALNLPGSGTQTPASFPVPNGATPELDIRESTLPLDAFAGTYTNSGYGSFTLCSPSSTSPYCTKVQSDFAIVDGIQARQNPSLDILAEWPRVWSSHVRMRHQQGSVFDMYFTTLYPHGYGKDVSPFETREVGTTEGLVEFVVEDGRVVGFGMSGLVGQLTERARLAKQVQDRAEVWFDKV